jgi:hypothetical protein
VITNSYGGNITLRLATRRPEVFRSLSCHEPPLWSLLEEDPEPRELLQQGARSLEAVGQRIAQGDHEGAARQFVEEVAFGPGAWESELLRELRAIFVDNAPTFLDELQDPNQLRVDADALSQLALPVRLTQGSASPPTFPAVIDRLVELIPRVSRETIHGAAHVPQLTMPERYVQVTTRGPASGGLSAGGQDQGSRPPTRFPAQAAAPGSMPRVPAPLIERSDADESPERPPAAPSFRAVRSPGHRPTPARPARRTGRRRWGQLLRSGPRRRSPDRLIQAGAHQARVSRHLQVGSNHATPGHPRDQPPMNPTLPKNAAALGPAQTN